MKRKAVKGERRARRVERAVRYIERRRERELMSSVSRAIHEQCREGFLEELRDWQTLPESLLIPLWRYRGRWPTRLEMQETLECVHRAARVAGQGDFGSLSDGDPDKEADIVSALITHFILDELSFDGPIFTSFCGRAVHTPLSKDGAFADLRLGPRIEV